MSELQPPSPWQTGRELLLGRDAVRLAVKSPSLSKLPRGDGAPVVLVAGFGAGDASLTPLRRFLSRLGHDAQPAELGRIGDDVLAQVRRLLERCAQIRRASGLPPALVGWSLGGVLSREVARERPDLVRRVITFGTPVEGGPAYTALAGRYDAATLAAIRERIDAREVRPVGVPVTAMWSRNDGIVTPEACIDRRTPGAENIEVTGTHVGMSIDPDVWSVIARRLAPDRP